MKDPNRTNHAERPSESSSQQVPLFEVRRYIKPDGWQTRYWAVYTSSETLIVVCLYKKGAQAVVDLASRLAMIRI